MKNNKTKSKVVLLQEMRNKKNKEGKFLNVMYNEEISQVLDLPMGKYIGCRFELASDLNGNVYHFTEVLPLYLSEEENNDLLEILEISKKITPEEMDALYTDKELKYDLKERLNMDKLSLTDFNTKLCTQEEMTETYCKYSSMLFDLLYGEELKEDSKVIPFVYTIEYEKDTEVVITNLIEPSRGYSITLYPEELDDKNEFELMQIGYIGSLKSIVKSILLRIALNSQKVDYFGQLAPIQEMVTIFKAYRDNADLYQ